MPAGLSLLSGKQRGAAAAVAAAKGAAAASASASNSNMHTLASPPPTPTHAGERRLSGSGTGSRSRSRARPPGGSLTPTAAARRLAVAARAQSPSPSRARSPMPPSPSASFARPPSSSCSAAFARQLADLAILSQQSQSQSSTQSPPPGLPPLPPQAPGPLPPAHTDALLDGSGFFNMGLDLSSNSVSGGSTGGGGGGLARRTARMQLDPLLRRASLGVVGDDDMEEADTKLEERARAVAEWRESLLPNPSRLVLKRQRTLDDSFLSPPGSSPVQPACEWLVPSWCKSVYPAYGTLAVLVQDAHKGVRCGFLPVPTPPPSCGGSYFIRNPLGRLAGVFKPLDEEAYAAANPAGFTYTSTNKIQSPGLGLRAGIPPGEAGIREAAAFVLDSSAGPGLAAGVPPTVLARLRCPARWGPLAKPGSLQLYAPHVGSADDFGPGMFDVGDAHRIMLLDLRILNQDRHAGNILVQDPTGGLSSSLRKSLGASAHGASGNGGPHRLLLPFETAASTALASPRTPPSTPSTCARPPGATHAHAHTGIGTGVLQPYNLPQPSTQPPKPLPFLVGAAAAAAAASSSSSSSPSSSLALDSPTVALRRTHSFGPALETATSAHSSSGYTDSSTITPSSSASAFTFSLPFPLGRASPPPGAALVRRQHSAGGGGGVGGGSRLRHEAGADDEEEEDDDDDEGDEMMVDSEGGGQEGQGAAAAGGQGRLRLVPIDHGFALPHSLRIDEAELCWLHWPQAKQPVSPPLRAAAAALDPDADIARLKATLGDVAVDGEGLPPHCFLTLRMGSELVRQGIGARNLTPYDLAGLLLGGGGSLDGSGGAGGGGGGEQQLQQRSRFEALVDATYAALAAEVRQQGPQGPQGQPQRQQRLLGQERYHGRFMELFAEGLRGVLDGVDEAKRRQAMLRSASS